MGLRINTNVSSIAAQRALTKTNADRKNSLGKLSSGSRIVTSADDAAGLAISEKLKASIRSSRQADRNANENAIANANNVNEDANANMTADSDTNCRFECEW